MGLLRCALAKSLRRHRMIWWWMSKISNGRLMQIVCQFWIDVFLMCFFSLCGFHCDCGNFLSESDRPRISVALRGPSPSSTSKTDTAPHCALVMGHCGEIHSRYTLDIFGHLWTSLDIFGHLTLQIWQNVLVFLGDFEGIPWHPKKTSLAGNCGTTGTQTAYR